MDAHKLALRIDRQRATTNLEWDVGLRDKMCIFSCVQKNEGVHLKPVWIMSLADDSFLLSVPTFSHGNQFSLQSKRFTIRNKLHCET